MNVTYIICSVILGIFFWRGMDEVANGITSLGISIEVATEDIINMIENENED